jgi:small neutral amino acid transporter SnatA (MarC family)
VDLAAVLSIALRVVVPIFVAMDPIGALPLVFAWTGSLDDVERERQLRDALLTALALGLVFVLGGRWLLGILGVEIPDVLVAGGLVLRGSTHSRWRSRHHPARIMQGGFGYGS